jgi:hypothetical protein
MRWTVMDQSIYLAILIVYLLLPSVSRNIFMAIQCESFMWDDTADKTRSFLLADPRINCNSGPDWDKGEFDHLRGIFWFASVLSPILVPLCFLALLIRVRPSVVEQRITRLANACRFLWRDYTAAFVFWEVIDLWRKVVLTAVILFADVEDGSTKALRLVVAAIVSAAYLAALGLSRPYRRQDDLYLAFTSSLLLTCSFVSGIVIHLCDNDDETLCTRFLGQGFTWFSSTVVLVSLSVGMLGAALLAVAVRVMTSVAEPTFRVASSGREPNLELSRDHHFHGFISHAWGTGQDQAHTVVRKLQLLLPGMRPHHPACCRC